MLTVFGSLNIDFVTRASAIPAPGETVIGPSYAVLPGGKGANQALAAARSGGRVRFIAARGHDPYAALALANLDRAGVDLSHLAAHEGLTGAAFITLDAAGENTVVVASGANASLTAAALEKAGLNAGDTLLMQLETPLAEVAAAARYARAQGAKVVLNIAPFAPFDPALLGAVDVLIANETEAEGLAARLGLTGLAPEVLAARLAQDHGLSVIITLGGEGALAAHAGEMLRLPAHRVAVVDTTGAGDAFCGVFAASLDAGLPFAQSLKRALAGGALACTGLGAQTDALSTSALERMAV